MLVADSDSNPVDWSVTAVVGVPVDCSSVAVADSVGVPVG